MRKFQKLMLSHRCVCVCAVIYIHMHINNSQKNSEPKNLTGFFKKDSHPEETTEIPCLPPQPLTSMLWSEVPSTININGCFFEGHQTQNSEDNIELGDGGTWPLWCGTSWDGCFWRTRYVVHIRNRPQYIRIIIDKRYYPSCIYINYIVSVSGIQWIIITSNWEIYVCNHGLIWMWIDDQENCWWDNIGTILVYIYVCTHIESHLMGNGFGDGSIGFLLSRDSNQMNVNFAWIGKVVITHRIRYPIFRRIQLRMAHDDLTGFDMAHICSYV